MSVFSPAPRTLKEILKKKASKMRLLILFSVLCSSSVLGYSLHGYHRHHEHKVKRQDAWTSTTKAGNTVMVYDYTVVEDRVTLKPGELPPTEATSTPSSSTSSSATAPVEEKLVVPSFGAISGWTHWRSTYSPTSSAAETTSSNGEAIIVSPSSSEPVPAPSPSTTEVASSSTQASIPVSTSSSVSVSSAVSPSPIASGQTSGVVATISSLTSPTASIVGENIVGTVCTASVSQLPTAFADYAIAAHNVHRANHSSPNVIWDNNLASAAASWASYCNFSHNVFVLLFHSFLNPFARPTSKKDPFFFKKTSLLTLAFPFIGYSEVAATAKTSQPASLSRTSPS